MSLYGRASIGPDELIAATQQVKAKWPNARLHKNDVTKNLSIDVDGERVGMLDLLNATVHDFTEEIAEGG